MRGRRIIDGHGDLRPEHIWLGDPVRIIDCLEFNKRLRTVDPFDEIAYLLGGNRQNSRFWEATLRNLTKLQREFPGLYTKWGFRDSVNVMTKVVSGSYLSLDQGMIMAALGNALDRDVLRRAFSDRALERGLRPVIGIEEFGASLSSR